MGRAAITGVVGPLAFLTVAFSLALLRPDLIRSEGWASWPSSMALGGGAGVPQVLAFLCLACCYPVFALAAIRPVLGNVAAWGGFLGIAAGDALLAFPTDATGVGPSWHGTLHLAGVVLATAASVVAAAGVTFATFRDPLWQPWRWVGAPSIAVACVIGAVAGFDVAWAKVVYVLGITLPVPLVALLLIQSSTAQPTSATPIDRVRATTR